MKQTVSSLFKGTLLVLGAAAVSFTTFSLLSKGPQFFSITRSNSVSEERPEPLPYNSVGNYPIFEEESSNTAQQREFTLELAMCKDTDCIRKSLDKFHRYGIDAFYTPSKEGGKVVFHIRQGVYTSRVSAERAQLILNSEKKIPSHVVEL